MKAKFADLKLRGKLWTVLLLYRIEICSERTLFSAYSNENRIGQKEKHQIQTDYYSSTEHDIGYRPSTEVLILICISIVLQNILLRTG